MKPYLFYRDIYIRCQRIKWFCLFVNAILLFADIMLAMLETLTLMALTFPGSDKRRLNALLLQSNLKYFVTLFPAPGNQLLVLHTPDAAYRHDTNSLADARRALLMVRD